MRRSLHTALRRWGTLLAALMVVLGTQAALIRQVQCARAHAVVQAHKGATPRLGGRDARDTQIVRRAFAPASGAPHAGTDACPPSSPAVLPGAWPEAPVGADYVEAIVLLPPVRAQSPPPHPLERPPRPGRRLLTQSRV